MKILNFLDFCYMDLAVVLFEINKEPGRRDHKKFYEDIDEAIKKAPDEEK